MYSGQKYCGAFDGDKKLRIIIAIFALSFVITTTSGEEYEYCAQTQHKPFKDAKKYESENGWQQWEYDGIGGYENLKKFFINHSKKQANSSDPTSYFFSSNPLPYPENLNKQYKLFKENSTIKPRFNKDESLEFHFDVKRWNIIADSYDKFSNEEAIHNFKKDLYISLDENQENYRNREYLINKWFWLLSSEISKKYFQSDADDKNNHKLEINPKSEAEGLNTFEFIGRVIGAAVYHRRPINMDFIEPYYKIMLGDKTREEKLISVENQMCAVLKGFADFIPLPYLRIFSSDELQTVIRGEKVTDNRVWERIISQNDKKFNDAVNTFNEEEREQLVQYVTGSPRIPLTELVIIGKRHMKEVAENDLPEVNHFNQIIKVCNKWSVEEMAEKIKMAMQKATNYELEASVKSPN